MIWLRHPAFVLVLGLLLAPCHAEDEKAGTACTHIAVIGADDEGLDAMYEGIRLGLEKAGLPRVCLEEVPPRTDDAWAAFDRKWTQRGKDTDAGEFLPLVFGLGDRVVEALRSRVTNLPKVFVIERLAFQGQPVLARPEIGPGQALVIAQVDAERLVPVLRRMTNSSSPKVLLPLGAVSPSRC